MRSTTLFPLGTKRIYWKNTPASLVYECRRKVYRVLDAATGKPRGYVAFDDFGMARPAHDMKGEGRGTWLVQAWKEVPLA